MALFSLSDSQIVFATLMCQCCWELSSEADCTALLQAHTVLGQLLYLDPNVSTTKRRFLPSRGLLLIPSPAGMGFGDITQPNVNTCHM